jgi:PAS domain S-box-containing protein
MRPRTIEPCIGTSAAHFSEIIEFFPDPCFAIDLQGTVIAWNRAVADLTGITATDMIGKRDYAYAIPFYGSPRPLLIDLALHWDEDAAKTYKYVKKKNDTLVAETENLRVGQALRRLWNTARKIYNAEGECIGAIEVIRDITELKKAEALNRRYDLLKEESRDIILFINQEDGRILEANQAALKAYGYSYDELLCMSISDLRVPSSKHLVEGQMSAANAQGIVFETEHKKRDGSTFFVEVSSRGATIGSQRLLISIIRDITERKQSEEALRKSEDKFSKAFHDSPSYLCITDTETGKYLMVNKAYCELTGYSAEEIIGKTSIELGFVTAQDRAEMLKALNEVGQTNTCESQIRTKSGEIRTRMLSAAVIEIQGKRAVISSGLDITDRKRAESALRDSEEKFRLFMDNSPTIAWIKDRKGRYVFFSRTAEKRFNFKTDEAIGKTDRELFPPELAAQFRKNDQYALSVGHAISQTEKVVGRDGKVSYWLNSKFPLQDSAGNPYVAGIGLDITERKLAEQAIKQLNETLEQRVTERTQLAETRAKQLQALAVELIEAEERERQRISQLLHDDLQQILAAARFQLQASCQNMPPDIMLTNVEQLLEESINKSRRLSHELSPVVLHHTDMLAALRWLVRQMNDQFGLDIQLDAEIAQRFESAPFRVFIFRAIQELLFNVVKHAGVKKASVRLSEADCGIDIEVADQGRGFDPAILESTTTTIGLGLLSLRERARYIGGGLVIQSTPGTGSRLTLSVPYSLAKDGLQPGRARRSATSAEGKRAERAGCIRVVFADDHQVMRQGLIKLIAGQPNIEVVGEAANGEEAVELARQLRPDVIVMDVSMPKMDGIEATRRIKSELPEVRVIGLSMFKDEQLARTMRQAGAETFLSKTTSSTELLQVIYGIASRA